MLNVLLFIFIGISFIGLIAIIILTFKIKNILSAKKEKSSFQQIPIISKKSSLNEIEISPYSSVSLFSSLPPIFYKEFEVEQKVKPFRLYYCESEAYKSELQTSSYH